MDTERMRLVAEANDALDTLTRTRANPDDPTGLLHWATVARRAAARVETLARYDTARELQRRRSHERLDTTGRPPGRF